MTVPVLLHGKLATHPRGKVLGETLSVTPRQEWPEGPAIVLAFADGFQNAEREEQERLIEWTRAGGHLLLLVPPFDKAACDRPVFWRAERVESAPRGGEGIAKVLAAEVGYRLVGQLQTPSIQGATWSDLSVCVGTYRLHAAAGLFAVTCLPIWSLSVLDAHREVEAWLTSLLDLAGDARALEPPKSVPLQPDHYGFLVFLLGQPFQDEEQVLAGLCSSSIFRFSAERGRSLLKELRERALVAGVSPTTEAQQLVMQSPYALYVSAVREVPR